MEKSPIPESGSEGCQRNDEGQWAVQQTLRTIACIPVRCTLALGIDHEQDASDLIGHAQASERGCSEELPSESLAGDCHIGRDSRQLECCHLMPGETARA